MVIFNELRITEDRSCLIVDCEIENVDIYKNMYISSIYLDYYKNASAASMPSSRAMCIYDNTSSNTSIKAQRITLTQNALVSGNMGVNEFKDGLFYVIVNCDGTLPATIGNFPCGYDDTTKIAVILDWKTLYERGMGYLASLFGDCGNPCADTSGFEHLAIIWNALRLAIDTCNWDLVKELWNKLVRTFGSYSAGGYSGCGCGH